jgi:thiol-disulfide isomerase/thioredoxin
MFELKGSRLNLNLEQPDKMSGIRCQGSSIGVKNMKSMMARRVPLILLSLIIVTPAGFAISQEIQWHAYNDGVARGKFENKKMFIHFFAEWCAVCRTMQKNTFSDPARNSKFSLRCSDLLFWNNGTVERWNNGFFDRMRAHFKSKQFISNFIQNKI